MRARPTHTLGCAVLPFSLGVRCGARIGASRRPSTSRTGHRGHCLTVSARGTTLWSDITMALTRIPYPSARRVYDVAARWRDRSLLDDVGLLTGGRRPERAWSAGLRAHESGAAVRVLGPGIEVFGEGPDGGRSDVPRPAAVSKPTEPWDGYGVLQAKHKAKIMGTGSDTAWLRQQVSAEMKAWTDPGKKRYSTVDCPSI